MKIKQVIFRISNNILKKVYKFKILNRYETINLIYKIFPLRTCKLAIRENGEKVRPCLIIILKNALGHVVAILLKKNMGR